ncbi:methyltransferase domain-containing protein [Kibdelosporangium philippinense]|uniref:Methyltransferase domain-containing protein n=1 Tax=Kibdelosporangium philippinense TaxID=211113 RepID=A0ABS8Z5N8_9PSEU|nr:class I SAM-dependent methyltransferase [Kibdelosporangium philippinense]MCE7002368.1 methyltransferase domain-containing protein [Kibdelosporangium philippinense]
MSDAGLVTQFMQAGQARASIENWATGAQVFGLLTMLHKNGWTNFLNRPRNLDELAEFSGLSPTRLADVLAVLEIHGIAERQDDHVQLSPAFMALTADNAWVNLDDVLDRAAMTTHLVAAAAQEPGTLPLTKDDALVLARAVGGQTTDVTQAVFEQVLFKQVPEIPEVIRTGRWLDIGCGVAGATLTFATMVPEMRAVAIEVVPDVAAEAQRRAEALGVADRVDIRCVDARDFDEQNAFDGAFWAQPFFAEPARAATLAMIRRALKPGGLLFVQEFEPEPTEAARPAYALRRLVFQGWEVPFGRTAEQLAAEAEQAGFGLARIGSSDFGRIVVLRREKRTLP